MARMTAEQVLAQLHDHAGACGVSGDKYDCGKSHGLSDAAALIRANLIQSEDESRAEFESWYRQYCHTSRKIFNRALVRNHRTGEYRNSEDAIAWHAWQASRTWRPTDERDPQSD